jgi:hypothetical protein
MSNVFLKNDLNGILDTITESNMSLPTRINIVNIANKSTNLDKTNYSVTSSAVVNQAGGGYSATSTNSNSIRDVNKLISMLTSESSTNRMFETSTVTSSAVVNQAGGGYSATSTNSNSIRDVNKLISMLTSESSTNSMSETSSVTLENKNSNKNKQRNNYGFRGGGHNNISVNDVKTFFKNFKVNNKNVNVKINDQNMSEFFNTKLIGGGGLYTNLLKKFNIINKKFINNKGSIQLSTDNEFSKSIKIGITDYYDKIKILLGIGDTKLIYSNNDYSNKKINNKIYNEIINSFDTVNNDLTTIIYAIKINKYNNIKKYYNETLNQSILAIEKLTNKTNNRNKKDLYNKNEKEYNERKKKYKNDYDQKTFENDQQFFFNIVKEYGGDNVRFTLDSNLLKEFNIINNKFINNKDSIFQLSTDNDFSESIKTGITDYYDKIKILLGIGDTKLTYSNNDYSNKNIDNKIYNEIINSFDTVNNDLTIIIYSIQINKYNKIKKYYNETLNQSILAIERLTNNTNNQNKKDLYSKNEDEYNKREQKYEDDYDQETFENDQQLFFEIFKEYGGDNVIFT